MLNCELEVSAYGRSPTDLVKVHLQTEGKRVLQGLETGAKVTVSGSGRAKVTVSGSGRAKVTVRGQGEWQSQGNCRGGGGGVAEPRYVTVRGSGRAKVCNCQGEWQSQGM